MDEGGMNMKHGEHEYDQHIPKEHKGNPWSVEQLPIHRKFTDLLITKKQTGKGGAIAVPSSAGSGKSSLITGMVEIVGNVAPELATILTAFNRHIALGGKLTLEQFVKSHGLNANILGGGNTVNAGGHQLLMSMATGCGFSRVELLDKGDERWGRICRIVLSGWLARKAENLQLIEVGKSVLNVKTTSSVFNALIFNGLLSATEMCMNEGVVPHNTIDHTRAEKLGENYYLENVHEADSRQVRDTILRVGKNQNWDDNTANLVLGLDRTCELVAEILAIGVETARLSVQLKPYCGEGKSFWDAIIPSKSMKGYPVDMMSLKGYCQWKLNNDDQAGATKQAYAIMNAGGCVFPPLGISTGESVKFDTDKFAIITRHGDDIVYSFQQIGEKKGWERRFQGKGIGTQLGFKGNASVNGENPADWRFYDKVRKLSIIKPDCVDKMVNLLSDLFGDEFENQLDDSVQIEEVDMSYTKGTCFLSMKDQIYLPHALDLQLPESKKAQVAFIDEVQDLSPLKAQLVWRLVDDEAVKVIVGDLKQAIYLWSGASNDAFSAQIEKLNAEVHNMTISWRQYESCARSARIACKYHSQAVFEMYGDDIDIPDYQSHRSALEAGYDFCPEGAEMVNIHHEELVDAYHQSLKLHGADTTFGLLCRIKKPLAGAIRSLLMAGIPVSTPSLSDDGGIVGEAFKIALSSLRSKELDNGKKATGKSAIGFKWTEEMSLLKMQREIEAMQTILFDKYLDLHKGDMGALNSDSNYEDSIGNLELLKAFISLFEIRTGDKKVDAKSLKKWVIGVLFESEDSTSAVHISSIHRYKGDEADVIFIIEEIQGEEGVEYTFMSKRSMEASLASAINELNMVYVAYTRSKKQNIIIRCASTVESNFNPDLKARMEGAFSNDMQLMTDTDYARSDEPNSPVCNEPGVNQEFERCVECSKIVTPEDEVTSCSKCGGHLCVVRYPSAPTPTESGNKLNYDGEINLWSSCGETSASLEELFDENSNDLEHRACSNCMNTEPGTEQKEVVKSAQLNNLVVRVLNESVNGTIVEGDVELWESKNGICIAKFTRRKMPKTEDELILIDAKYGYGDITFHNPQGVRPGDGQPYHQIEIRDNGKMCLFYLNDFKKRYPDLKLNPGKVIKQVILLYGWTNENGVSRRIGEGGF